MILKTLIFLLVISTISVAYVFVEPMINGELSSKPVYAALQAAEIEHRNSENKILYQEKGGYQMAGLANSDQKRIWIVLNTAKNKAELYSIPNLESVPIECNAIDLLISMYRTKTEVAELLRNSCTR